jgi:hypothetical protein
MRPAPAGIAVAALALSACAEVPGYAFCYDPYGGPTGYYTGRLEDKPHCPASPTQAAYFSGPYYGGWRGPYVSGPYSAAPQPVAEPR